MLKPTSNQCPRYVWIGLIWCSALISAGLREPIKIVLCTVTKRWIFLTAIQVGSVLLLHLGMWRMRSWRYDFQISTELICNYFLTGSCLYWVDAPGSCAKSAWENWWCDFFVIFEWDKSMKTLPGYVVTFLCGDTVLHNDRSWRELGKLHSWFIPKWMPKVNDDLMRPWGGLDLKSDWSPPVGWLMTN